MDVVFGEEVSIEPDILDNAFADVSRHLDGAAFRACLVVGRVVGRITIVPLPSLVLPFCQLVDYRLLLVGKVLQIRHLVLLHDEVHQVILELQNGHGAGEVLRNVGDAAADGFHRLVLEFGRIDLERARNVGHLGGEKQGAMLQDAVFVEHHGVAGDFLAVNHQVVAPRKLRRDA